MLRKRPFYTRIALTGIAMYLAIEVLIFLGTLAFEPDIQLWYPVIVGGIVLAGGAFIYFWHPWGLVVGIIGGLLGIFFSLDGIRQNLASPESFLDFAYRPVIWFGGTILVLAGSIGGLIQHFRGRTSEQGPAASLRAAQGIVAIVIIISLASAALTIRGIHHVSANDRAGATIVEISGWRFSTDAISVPSGGETKLVIENNDANIHTFTVEGLGLDMKLGPFGDTLIVLDAPPPGRYEFHCRITGHEAMHGIITVE